MFSLAVRDCQSKLYLLPNYSTEEMLLAVCVAAQSILSILKRNKAKRIKKNAVNAQLNKCQLFDGKKKINGNCVILKAIQVLFH